MIIYRRLICILRPKVVKNARGITLIDDRLTLWLVLHLVFWLFTGDFSKITVILLIMYREFGGFLFRVVLSCLNKTQPLTQTANRPPKTLTRADSLKELCHFRGNIYIAATITFFNYFYLFVGTEVPWLNLVFGLFLLLITFSFFAAIRQYWKSRSFITVSKIVFWLLAVPSGYIIQYAEPLTFFRFARVAFAYEGLATRVEILKTPHATYNEKKVAIFSFFSFDSDSTSRLFEIRKRLKGVEELPIIKTRLLAYGGLDLLTLKAEGVFMPNGEISYKFFSNAFDKLPAVKINELVREGFIGEGTWLAMVGEGFCLNGKVISSLNSACDEYTRQIAVHSKLLRGDLPDEKIAIFQTIRSFSGKEVIIRFKILINCKTRWVQDLYSLQISGASIPSDYDHFKLGGLVPRENRSPWLVQLGISSGAAIDFVCKLSSEMQPPKPASSSHLK